MFPATYNISYYQGDTYSFIAVPRNADKTLFDLTSYSVEMTITDRAAFNQNAEAVIDLDYGTITCTILPGLGATLNAGTTYFYDVQIVNTEDPIVANRGRNVYTILKGSISVTEDITQ
jgi:hypothetical protein